MSERWMAEIVVASLAVAIVAGTALLAGRLVPSRAGAVASTRWQRTLVAIVAAGCSCAAAGFLVHAHLREARLAEHRERMRVELIEMTAILDSRLANVEAIEADARARPRATVTDVVPDPSRHHVDVRIDGESFASTRDQTTLSKCAKLRERASPGPAGWQLSACVELETVAIVRTDSSSTPYDAHVYDLRDARYLGAVALGARASPALRSPWELADTVRAAVAFPAEKE
jgi:hypothetical protein